VPAALHVEQGVLTLFIASRFHIVIAKHGVEVDVVFQNAVERLFEVPLKMTRAAVRIDVVTRRDHEVERTCLVRVEHLFGNASLLVAAGAPVSYQRKMQTILCRRSGEDRTRSDHRAGSDRSQREQCLPSGYPLVQNNVPLRMNVGPISELLKAVE